MDAGRNSPSIRQQPNQITYIMTTNTIELPCGATIVTDKVCGKYYIKATQRRSGKNIIVILADNAFKYLSTNMYK